MYIMSRQSLQRHSTLQESIIPKLKRVFTDNNVKKLIPLSENTRYKIHIKLSLKKYVNVARKMD